MIRLHQHPFSTFARRVRIALIEKDIAHESVLVDMTARKHRAPEYLALNPYGRVPALEDDGFILFESNAILQYLEAVHPEPPLLPADAKGRALADMHMRLCDTQMGAPSGTIIFPKRFLPPERWDSAAIGKAQADLGKHLQILSTQLGDADYLVGGEYSLADIAYIPFLEFLPIMDLTVPANLAAWSARLLARPSSIQTKPAK